MMMKGNVARQYSEKHKPVHKRVQLKKTKHNTRPVEQCCRKTEYVT